MDPCTVDYGSGEEVQVSSMSRQEMTRQDRKNEELLRVALVDIWVGFSSQA